MLSLRTIQGSFWVVFSRLAGRVVDFLTLIILARVLSPADFGLTALAVAFVAIVDVVLEIPLYQALIRLPELGKAHFDTSFTLGLIRAAVLLAIVAAAAWPLAHFYAEPRLVPLLAVLSIASLARSIVSPKMAIFLRNIDFRRLFAMEMAGKIVAFGVMLLVLQGGGGYWAIVANSVSASVAAVMMSYIFAPYRPSLSLARFPDFSRYIGWFSLSQLVSALNWQFDRLLVAGWVDKPTFGTYAQASDLAVLPTQSLIGPAMQPAMAAFSRIHSDLDRLQRAVLKAARIAMLLSLPICVGVSVTADLIVGLVLGPQWAGAAPFLRWLSLSVATVPYFQTLYAVAMAMDKPEIVFRLNVMDLGLRIVFVLAGLAVASLPGVIGARILVSLAMFGVVLFTTRRLVSLGILVQLRNVAKIALAAGLMGGAVWVLRHWLLPFDTSPMFAMGCSIATGVVAYAAFNWLLGLRLIFGGGRFDIFDRSLTPA